MIELLARLYCDRCHVLIAEMLNVDSMAEAEDRAETLSGSSADYSLDENGSNVCAVCWRKWDAAHPSESVQEKGPDDAR